MPVKRSTAARALPSTSTFTVPSGSFSSCSTLAITPTSKMSFGVGSSMSRSRWVASRICLSPRITSSSARTDFSRPTNSGTDHVREDHDVPQRQHRKREYLGHDAILLTGRTLGEETRLAVKRTTVTRRCAESGGPSAEGGGSVGSIMWMVLDAVQASGSARRQGVAWAW